MDSLFETKRFVTAPGDVVVHKGVELDAAALDAVADAVAVGPGKRLLWAFLKGAGGGVRAVPYSEDRVIWMAEDDVLAERDVEI